jgi:hypothetical protein
MPRRRSLGKLKGLKCPRCGKHGSVHAKWVKGYKGRKKYEPFYYVAHFSMNEGRRKIKWCYLGKRRDLGKIALRAVRTLESKKAKRRKKSQALKLKKLKRLKVKKRRKKEKKLRAKKRRKERVKEPRPPEPSSSEPLISQPTEAPKPQEQFT